MNCQIRLRANLDGSVAGCVLSSCEQYRYALWRIWETAKPLWMMALLNPSTATEEADDPTITRCSIRAQRNGAGGLVVVNAGAIRETDAEKACRAEDPVGPFNYDWIAALIPSCRLHIAGWGPKASRFSGDENLRRLFREAGVPLYALQLNQDGSPRHPLYVSYDAQPFVF
jgi:hypothetical protein